MKRVLLAPLPNLLEQVHGTPLSSGDARVLVHVRGEHPRVCARKRRRYGRRDNFRQTGFFIGAFQRRRRPSDAPPARRVALPPRPAGPTTGSWRAAVAGCAYMCHTAHACSIHLRPRTSALQRENRRPAWEPWEKTELLFKSTVRAPRQFSRTSGVLLRLRASPYADGSVRPHSYGARTSQPRLTVRQALRVSRVSLLRWMAPFLS